MNKKLSVTENRSWKLVLKRVTEQICFLSLCLHCSGTRARQHRVHRSVTDKSSWRSLLLLLLTNRFSPVVRLFSVSPEGPKKEKQTKQNQNNPLPPKNSME